MELNVETPHIVAPGVARVLANNPGPLTLDGTNTYIVYDAGARTCLVIDPGPASIEHLDAIEAAAELLGGQITAIAATHEHADHTEAIEPLARRTDARILGVGGLVDETLTDFPQCLEVIRTPGHTRRCVSFLHCPTRSLITGDFVLGRGTTMIAHPEGTIRDYLESLERVSCLVASGSITMFLPGHGPAITEPGPWLSWLRAHRLERLAQVREATRTHGFSVVRIVNHVYADVAPGVREAAMLSTAAQLEYLVGE